VQGKPRGKECRDYAKMTHGGEKKNQTEYSARKTKPWTAQESGGELKKKKKKELLKKTAVTLAKQQKNREQSSHHRACKKEGPAQGMRRR